MLAITIIIVILVIQGRMRSLFGGTSLFHHINPFVVVVIIIFLGCTGGSGSFGRSNPHVVIVIIIIIVVMIASVGQSAGATNTAAGRSAGFLKTR